MSNTQIAMCGLLVLGCCRFVNSETPPCTLKMDGRSREPPMFQSPERGKIFLDLVRYTVRNSDPSGLVCVLPIDEFLCKSGNCIFDEYWNFYPIFTCDPEQRLEIVFTNPLVIKSDVLGYIRLVHCDVSLTSLATYGKAVDFKVAFCQDCTLKTDMDSTNNLQPEDHDNLTIVPGLENLVCIGLSARFSQNETIPTALSAHKWPALAELKLNNFNVTGPEINNLRGSMPILQSLEIANSAIALVPAFPWDPNDVVLPLNFSRTPLFNDIYANTLGISIEPHLFRRNLNIDKCKLKVFGNRTFTGRLDMISLDGNGIDELGADTFSKVDNLYNLKLSSNRIHNLPSGVFRNLDMLVKLDLSYNQLHNISEDIFIGLENLKFLYLANNRLTNISPNSFAQLSMLVSLDISNNSISSVSDMAFGGSMPNGLALINLENNKMVAFPKWIFTARGLTNIRLSRNLLSFEILKRDMHKLNAYVITLNNRESASSLILPYKPRTEKLIDLSHNNFTSLDVEEILTNATMLTLLQVILNYFTIDLKGNHIRCDCKSYSMYRFLKTEEPKLFLVDYSQPRVKDFYFKSWQCSEPVHVQGLPIVDVSPGTFVCEQDLVDCPAECSCSKRVFDGSVIVNCTGKDMKAMPEKVPGKTDTVLLARNAIEHIDDKPYLKSLKVLDLSNNHIKEIFENALASIDNNGSRVSLNNNNIRYLPQQVQHLQNVILTLAGNSLECNCRSKWMVRWIFSYRTNIPDINAVVCDSGPARSHMIYLADEDDFICEFTKAEVEAIAITVGVVLTLVIILLVLAYKLRGEIKVFLYFHFNWHPFDRTDGSDIVDKLYDAFVSYNKADTEWVMNTLKPALENETYPFRLCIHERDFKPGGMVTDNVLFSVKYSRRMIMVLTKSFLQSEWCRLEFKSAHQRVLKDRTNYLIVILFDGLNFDDLDEDMQLYLKTNTYIEYNSTWFLQRLLYAMPQKSLSVLREEAFPKGGYNTLFPCPESVGIMQHIRNLQITEV